jgi:hypothetical protein
LVTHLDRCHAVRRTHEIAQNGERRHLIRRAIGQRYRYELRSHSSAQAEVDPPAKDHAVGQAMAAANLCHAGTRLLRLLHDRSLLLVAEATAVRPPVPASSVKRYLTRAQLAALLNWARALG